MQYRVRRLALLSSTVLVLLPAAALAQQNAPSTQPSAALAQQNAPSTQPSAQTEEANSDIVVTATRRAERSQDVPISLKVFDGATLERANVRSISDIAALTPSLQTPISSSLDNIRIAIRGVGSPGNSAIETSVAAFVDGEYLARPGGLIGNVVDLAAVEVLRGPQGTLFGRNSTAGAISIRTNNPSLDGVEGFVEAGYGSYDRYETSGVINLPLGPTTAIRVAGIYSDREGYGRNVKPGYQGRVGDATDGTARAKFLFEPNGQFRLLLRGDYSRSTSGGPIFEFLSSSTNTPLGASQLAIIARLTGAPAGDTSDTYDYKINQVESERARLSQYGFGMEGNLELGDYTVRMLTAYRHYQYKTSDREAIQVGVPLVLQGFDKDAKSFSQELQLISPNRGFLRFVSGLYYYDERYDDGAIGSFTPQFCTALGAARGSASFGAQCNAMPLIAAVTSQLRQKTQSFAGFVQATLHFSEQLQFIAGGRYTVDDKHGFYSNVARNSQIARVTGASEPFRRLEVDGNRFTYLGSFQYRPTSDVMLYSTYSTGYKGGGFDSDAPGSRAQNGLDPVTGRDRRVFGDETVKNIELGAKTQVLDRRLTTNVSLFRTKFDGFQTRVYDGIGFRTFNAGKLRIQGAEFDVTTRPLPRLTVGLGGTYLDSEYTSYRNGPQLPGIDGVQDLTGTRPNYTSRWQLAGNVDYRVNVGSALAAVFRTDWAYRSQQNIGSQGNNNPQTLQSGYSTANVRLALRSRDERWEVAGFVQNLTDRRFCTSETVQPLFGDLVAVGGRSIYRCTLGAPRTYGGNVRLIF